MCRIIFALWMWAWMQFLDDTYVYVTVDIAHNSQGHPWNFPMVFGTWLNSFFFWNRGNKTPPKRMKIEGSLTFHRVRLHVCFRLAGIQNQFFFFKLILRIFQIFHLFSVTSEIAWVLQNGACEWVVSKDRTLIYDPVWRFTRSQYPVLYFWDHWFGFFSS